MMNLLVASFFTFICLKWSVAVVHTNFNMTAGKLFESFRDGISVPFHKVQFQSFPFLEDVFDVGVIENVREREGIVLIGARNMVAELDINKREKVKSIQFYPDDDENYMMSESCQNDPHGYRRQNCHNLIRMIVYRHDKYFVCGTRSRCEYLQQSDISKRVAKSQSPLYYIPKRVDSNVTYIGLPNGDIFSAFTENGNSMITKQGSGSDTRNAVRTTGSFLSTSTNFVYSFEQGEFVYFLFRELESSNLNVQGYLRKVVTRIARICKNDQGLEVNPEHFFTTFTKATLVCEMRSYDGTTFDFDHVQSADFDDENNILYAVFTTPLAGAVTSSICKYDLSDINGVFNRRYLVDVNLHYEPGYRFSSNNFCSGSYQKDYLKYYFMEEVIESINQQVLHYAPFEIYTYILKSSVQPSGSMGLPVLFVLTKNGLLKKFSLFKDETCLVEVVQLTRDNSDLNVLTAKVSIDKSKILIGSRQSLKIINVSRCNRFTKEAECIDAQDPYCGWDKHKRECVAVNDLEFLPPSWLERVRGCPRADITVHGGWTEWSLWGKCPQRITDTKNVKHCKCRSRNCTNPSPKNGGKTCVYPYIQVKDCERDGDWTVWTAWTECSVTCGTGSMQRRRSCSNPSPAYDGLTCGGHGVDTRVCDKGKCPPKTEDPIDGEWNNWTDWTECSTKCDGGYRNRKRICNAPKNGGLACAGDSNQYEECNSRPCEEIVRSSAWSDWFETNKTQGVLQDGSYAGKEMQRFRFDCFASVPNRNRLRVSNLLKEVKYCGDHKKCFSKVSNVDGGWSGWSQWSQCTKSCRNGTQLRIRQCDDPVQSGSGLQCSGHSKELRHCNQQDCHGTWTCWSSFEKCSPTCGLGVKRRRRDCVRLPGQLLCAGEAVQEEACDNVLCGHSDGYSDWSEWSSCTDAGFKVHLRQCLTRSICGTTPKVSMQECSPSEVMIAQRNGRLNESTIFGLPMVIGAGIGGLFVGVLLTLLCFYVAGKRRSNCLYPFMPKYGLQSQLRSLPPPPRHNPPTPQVAKANIYTPPPSLRNIHPMPSLTLNPLMTSTEQHLMNTLTHKGSSGIGSDLDDWDDDVPTEQETMLTLKRGMRTMTHQHC